MGRAAPSEGQLAARTQTQSRVLTAPCQNELQSGTIEEVYGLHAKAWGITREQFAGIITSRTHAKRLPSLTEMANVAAFAASDQASAMTGTIVNLSLGHLDD